MGGSISAADCFVSHKENSPRHNVLPGLAKWQPLQLLMAITILKVRGCIVYYGKWGPHGGGICSGMMGFQWDLHQMTIMELHTYMCSMWE